MGSKRTGVRDIDLQALDIRVEEDEGSKKPPKPERCGFGEVLFMIAQIITMIFIAAFCTYESTDDDDQAGSATLPDYAEETVGNFSPAKDYVQRLYPVFQDVHVMIFIGFGFLMTFIKTSSWSALAFNWIISGWALQWGILTTGFWHQVTHECEGDNCGLHKIRIDIAHLIMGDFAAGAAMITFGAVLGKINLQQMFFLVWWEMVWYGLNEAICVNYFHVTDAGGSILVHTFGAYFGVAATFGFQPTRAAKSLNNQSTYQSELVACVGSIFLWMFWPSFNGGLSEGTTQHRIICNTTLGITGSVIAAAATSRIIYAKLEMEIILNATLAGGVAVGSSCDLICEPWAAIAVGMAGGILSSLGFAYIGPALAESKIALADTCGVHSLHGMPGVFAAIVSMIYLTTLESKNFPKDYFYFTDPGNYIENQGLPTEKAGETGTYNDQAVAQLKSLLVTLAISIVSGLSGGFLCSLDFWKPVHALFRDDDHFYHVLEKYPKHYLENVDESLDYGKVALSNIQAILISKLPSNLRSQEERNAWVGEAVYDKFVQHGGELNKNQLLEFLNDFLDSERETIGHEDGNVDAFLAGSLFNKIFQLLDDDKSGKVSRSEVCAYFTKILGDEKTEGPEQLGVAAEDLANVNFAPRDGQYYQGDKRGGEQELKRFSKLEGEIANAINN